MGYPPQPPYGGPQQPYGQQPQQGYPQQPYGQAQPTQGYPPQQYQQDPSQQFVTGGSESYNFAQLYGQADLSAGSLLEKGKYVAKPETAEFGRSKDGTKGQWTVQFRTQTGVNKNPQGPGNGAKLTVTLSISPRKNDGTDNSAGLGIMFKQLWALGIPVGPPLDPSQRPFWELGMNEQQVAQEIVRQARLVELTVTQNEWPEGSGQFNNKISRIDPLEGQPPAQPVQGQQHMGFPQQPGFQAPQPPQQAPQQFGGPAYGEAPGQPQQPPQGYPPQPFQGGPGAPGQPVQGAGPYPPAGPGQPPQGYNPAVPGYAQPAQPGAPGLGQFTQEGQAVQPGTNPAQNGYPQQPAPQGQPPQGDAPPMPPWA